MSNRKSTSSSKSSSSGREKRKDVKISKKPRPIDGLSKVTTISTHLDKIYNDMANVIDDPLSRLTKMNKYVEKWGHLSDEEELAFAIASYQQIKKIEKIMRNYKADEKKYLDVLKKDIDEMKKRYGLPYRGKKLVEALKASVTRPEVIQELSYVLDWWEEYPTDQ